MDTVLILDSKLPSGSLNPVIETPDWAVILTRSGNISCEEDLFELSRSGINLWDCRLKRRVSIKLNIITNFLL